MRRVKTYLRSTMSTKRLNSLCVLHTHQTETQSLDVDSIMNKFVGATDQVAVAPLARRRSLPAASSDMSDNVHVFGFSLSQRCPQVGLIWAGWGEVGIVECRVGNLAGRFASHSRPQKIKHADISGCVRCVAYSCVCLPVLL